MQSSQSEGQFFCDGASQHHKKIEGVLQGFALHPKISTRVN